MIAKNLKAGETFQDGELSYTVVEVLPGGNYHSKVVSREDKMAKAAEAALQEAAKAALEAQAAAKAAKAK